MKNKEKYVLGLVIMMAASAASGSDIPVSGDDISGDLEAIGTVVKTADTIIFGWVTKIIAGAFLISAGLAIKSTRVALASLCFLASMLLIFTPWIVNNVSNATDYSSVLK